MKSSVTKPATAVEQCQVKSRKNPFTLFNLPMILARLTDRPNFAMVFRILKTLNQL